MKKKPVFVYEHSKELQLARERLKVLQANNQALSDQRQELAYNEFEAQQNYLLTETKAAIGEATAEDIDAARADWFAAKQALENYEPRQPDKDPTRGSLNYLYLKIEELEAKEKAANQQKWLPLMREVASELDQLMLQVFATMGQFDDLTRANPKVGAFVPNIKITKELYQYWRECNVKMGTLD